MHVVIHRIERSGFVQKWIGIIGLHDRLCHSRGCKTCVDCSNVQVRARSPRRPNSTTDGINILIHYTEHCRIHPIPDKMPRSHNACLKNPGGSENQSGKIINISTLRMIIIPPASQSNIHILIYSYIRIFKPSNTQQPWRTDGCYLRTCCSTDTILQCTQRRSSRFQG